MSSKLQSILSPFLSAQEIPQAVSLILGSFEGEADLLIFTTYLAGYLEDIQRRGAVLPSIEVFLKRFHYEFDRPQYEASRHDAQEKALIEKYIDEAIIESPDLECPQCGGHRFRIKEVQKRSSDEPPTWIRTCAAKKGSSECGARV